MADYFVDDSFTFDPTPADSDALYYLANSGTAFIARSLTNSGVGTALQLGAKQDVLLASSTMISAKNVAIDFHGNGGISGNHLNNLGSVYALGGTGIQFSGGGTNKVTNQGSIAAKYAITIAGPADASNKLDLFNAGSIVASEVAVIGGIGDDRVINNGIMRSNGGILMDLGKGDDFYDGSSGSSFGKIVLGEGNDTAIGGAGSDHFVGGAGNDYLDGGVGSDTADYSDELTGQTAGVSVDLRSTTWQDVGGGHGRDLLINIENIVGTKYSDYLTGNNGDNKLEGGAGDDNMEGGLGNDILDGGAGIDTARYYGSAGAAVNLSDTGLQNTSGYGWDILKDIENVDGSSGNDTIIGSDDANKLYGNNGNDRLSGGKGNDTLEGGFGDDTLEGGEGNDSLIGGPGNDTAVFSGFKSEYVISVTSGDENTEYTVEHTLPGGLNGKDTLKGIRVLKFLGDLSTDEDDLIISLNNAKPTNITLSGSGVRENAENGDFVGLLTATDPDGDSPTFSLVEGYDAGGRFKISADGRSLLVADKTKLNYDNADGTVTTSYTIKVKANDGFENGVFEKEITVSLLNVVEDTPIKRVGTSGNDSSVNGENGDDIVDGGAGNDSVYGGAGNDKVYGGDGDDRVFGEAGNDKLYGGIGSDVLYGGAGDDTIYGGAGSDYLLGDTVGGGTGHDTFVLDTKPSKSNMDYLYDFDPTYDKIWLPKSIFKALPLGQLTDKAFYIGSKFHDNDDRIVYLSKVPGKDYGALFYDPDGKGPAKWTQIALLPANLSLTAANFEVVDLSVGGAGAGGVGIGKLAAKYLPAHDPFFL